jgi:hypothetical protein
MHTEHGIDSVMKWLRRHHSALPTDFNLDLIQEALTIVMTQNVFQFDDTFWIQECGTAMGTSVACMYATIVYSYHEETTLLPTYSNGGPLLFYRRYIDDTFIIWNNSVPYAPWNSFLENLPYGTLTWTADPLSESVNFLDLTLSVSNGHITSKSCEKPHNLHLHLPPTSAHTPGVLKSLIYGSTQRYWKQNTNTSDYTNMISQLRQHLLARGHIPSVIDPLFLEAAGHIDRPKNNPAKQTAAPQLFLHWEYHPKDIPRQQLRTIFNSTCAQAFAEARTPRGNKPLTSRLTIAYSKPNSIGNRICRTQLAEPTGENISDMIPEMLTATSGH